MSYIVFENTTRCLSTDPTKVQAFYAHLGWNFSLEHILEDYIGAFIVKSLIDTFIIVKN